MKIKKRFVTLIEMMIVMFLIALIGGVIAYNTRGIFDEGKAFKTKESIKQLTIILNLKAAEDPKFIDHIDSWRDVVKSSPLVHNPNNLIKDGWGDDFDVTVDDNVIKVHSKKYDDYKRSHPTMFSDEGVQQ